MYADDKSKSDTIALTEKSSWDKIDWRKAEKEIKKLQGRIAKAVKEGNQRKVKALQWILSKSFYAKALAVRRVTTNKGGKTPGVDGITLKTPEEKAQMVKELKRLGYKARPLRRVFIPKTNGKQRALGIPTVKDRAMQALYLFTLEPVSETTGDLNSYGFRPYRACRDAAGHLFTCLATKRSARWVLEADILGCFDNISHDWLMNNVPMDRRILHEWLKSGFIWQRRLFPTDAGTPQGGIASPVLANLVLDGMEKVLATIFPRKKGHESPKVNLVRYADDFIVTGSSPEILEKAKSAIALFLEKRGLQFSPEKTKISNIKDGFDFLGWNFRKYGKTQEKLLITPSKKNVKTCLENMKRWVEKSIGVSQEVLIHQLNLKIKGWTEYHKNQVAKKTFSYVDMRIWRMTWHWATRRHPDKSAGWIKNRYWKKENGRNWVFTTKTVVHGKVTDLRLMKAADVPIRRYTKIKTNMNPYDLDSEEYFEKRAFNLAKGEKIPTKVVKLIVSQKGGCAYCKRSFIEDMEKFHEHDWHVHHIKLKLHGGTDNLSNLALLHPECHRNVHRRMKCELPVALNGNQEATRPVRREAVNA